MRSCSPDLSLCSRLSSTLLPWIVHEASATSDLRHFCQNRDFSKLYSTLSLNITAFVSQCQVPHSRGLRSKPSGSIFLSYLSSCCRSCSSGMVVVSQSCSDCSRTCSAASCDLMALEASSSWVTSSDSSSLTRSCNNQWPLFHHSAISWQTFSLLNTCSA